MGGREIGGRWERGWVRERNSDRKGGIQKREREREKERSCEGQREREIEKTEEQEGATNDERKEHEGKFAKCRKSSIQCFCVLHLSMQDED